MHPIPHKYIYGLHALREVINEFFTDYKGGFLKICDDNFCFFMPILNGFFTDLVGYGWARVV